MNPSDEYPQAARNAWVDAHVAALGVGDKMRRAREREAFAQPGSAEHAAATTETQEIEPLLQAANALRRQRAADLAAAETLYYLDK